MRRVRWLVGTLVTLAALLAACSSDPPCGDDCRAGAFAVAACVEGACVLSCLEGRADCDGDPATGCEVDPSTASDHCGGCRLECGGGSCEAGRCQPVELVAGLERPLMALASDDGSVVVLVEGAPEGEGEEQTFPHGQVLLVSHDRPGEGQVLAQDQERVKWLARDVSHAYWTRWGADPESDAGAVMRVALGGGSSEPVMLDVEQPFGIAVDDEHVFVSSRASNDILRLRKGEPGANADLVTTGLEPMLLVRYATELCWSEYAGSIACADVTSPSGGAPAVSGLPPRGPFHLAVDDRHVYWSSFDVTTGTRPGRLSQAVRNGPVLLLGAENVASYGLALRDGHVYWSEWGVAPRLTRAAIDGGAVETLAETAAAAAGLSATERGIYWVETDSGRVMFLRPPP
jgi:hypothetical protein